MKNLRQQSGFTLIELMIVVAIIAILAAIALPAYQNYITRTQVSEVIVAASAGRTDLAEIYASGGSFPATGDYALQTQESQFVDNVAYSSSGANNAVITVTAQNLRGNISGNITLTGTGTPSTGTVAWVCDGSIPERFRPGSCQG